VKNVLLEEGKIYKFNILNKSMKQTYNPAEVSVLTNRESAKVAALTLETFLNSIGSPYSLYVISSIGPITPNTAVVNSVEGIVENGSNRWYFTKLPENFFNDLEVILTSAEIIMQDVESKLKANSQAEYEIPVRLIPQFVLLCSMVKSKCDLAFDYDGSKLTITYTRGNAKFLQDLLKRQRQFGKKDLEKLEDLIKKKLPFPKREDAANLVNAKYIASLRPQLVTLKKLYNGCRASAVDCYDEYIRQSNQEINKFVEQLPKPILFVLGKEKFETYFYVGGKIKKFEEDISHLSLPELYLYG
jgi:hypothetical protein